MNENNFWGTTRSSGVKVGMIVRIALALFATFGSIALAWTLLNPHGNARATGVVEVGTKTNPWGLVQDGTHIWVAEPGCDLSPKCQTQFPGFIGEYTQTNPPTSVQDYQEPTGFTSPGFVALDGKGNIWFTEPTSDAIGELTPPTTPTAQPTWQQWGTAAGITASSAPRDLVFDKHGNIWFTEATGNKIGFFNTTTHTAVETALSTAASDPYGIAFSSTTNTIWFGENGNTMLGSFKPSTTGTITLKEHSIGPTAHSHMVAIDASGNIWYSEGPADAVGEYSPTTNHFRDLSVTSAICPSGSPASCLTNTYVAGVAVDGTGAVWFDEVHTGSVGFITPPAGPFIKTHKTPTPTVTSTQTPTATPTKTPTPVGSPTPTTGNTTISAIISNPFDGLITDGTNNVLVTEKSSKKLALIPPGTRPTPVATGTTTGTATVTATGTPSGTITGPVSKQWYFAEGKVGAGFTEFLTLENPDTANSCAVNIQYLLGSGSPVNVPVTVAPASRFTESVNTDLSTPASAGTYQTDSAIVTVTSTATPNCTGVVAERPMYFTNFIGVSSGSDVLGSTHTGTSFYFADVPTGGGYASFLTILNPGTTTANITATFVVGGATVTTQTLAVPAGTRGTIIPNNTGTLHHAAVTVTSDQPVVVERPEYFSNVNGGNAGTVSGASSVVGVRTLKNDWLFAEGYTGGSFQEYFVLANFGTTAVSANVVLEFSNGHTETVPETIAPSDQTFVNVNAIIANHLGTCDTPACQPTADVSAEISAGATSPFIAQREMYFQYTHIANGRSLSAVGGTDVIGQSAAVTAYSFAEGYTNLNYDVWLTLQNPTANNESISLKLVNADGRSFSQTYSLLPHSRFTIDITALVLHNLIVPNDTFRGYEVSLTSQSSAGKFMAERPMYWNTGSSGTQGGSDVIGYDGT